MELCKYLNRLYAKKNHDYGDSFHTSFVEEGLAMARIRLGDKLSRFKALSRQGERQVQDESMRDTLLDLANYAIMTVMELDTEDGHTNTLHFRYSTFISSAFRFPVNVILPKSPNCFINLLMIFPYVVKLFKSLILLHFVISLPAI